MGVKKIFKRVLQVGVVVKDLEAAIKNYESFGIGPWEVHTRDALTLRDMTVRNERKDFAMRLAFAKIGDFQWELIQPLDEKSIYAEFLEKHGEGLHHVAFDVDNFDDTLAFCQGKGIGVLQGGTTAFDFSFAYLDTEKTLACITEIYNPPPKK
jgi:catechol 2,3-dioxygenase-like lactoylglutathione lyase family enzyme